MRNILLFFMLISAPVVWGQKDSFMVNNTSFVMVKATEWRDGSRDTVVKWYRVDSMGQTTYLLEHYISQISGDCNNIFEDVGSYIIEEDKIIFITDHYQKLNDPIPSKRKQIYQVMDDGKLIEIYDKQLVPWADGWVDTNE